MRRGNGTRSRARRPLRSPSSRTNQTHEALDISEARLEHAAAASFAATGKSELTAAAVRNEGHVRTDDFLHLLRHDTMKFNRAVGLINKNETIARAKESAHVHDDLDTRS